MGLAGPDAGRRGGARVLAHQGGEGFAGADLQHAAARHAQQLVQPVGKAHGMAQVAGPVGGAHGLLGRDGLAGHAGDEGQARRVPGGAGHHLLQLRQQGLGHGRVRGHGNVQAARGDVTRAQRLFGRLDGGQRAGQHAQALAVDGAQVAARVQQRLQFGLGQGHRGHGALRQRLQQAAARRDDAQGMR